MTILITVSEMTCVLAAHILVGMLSTPLKYRRSVVLAIWCIWAPLQGGLTVASQTLGFSTGLDFLIGFGGAFVGQYLIFFLTTQGKFLYRLFSILTYSTFFCIYMGLSNALVGSFSHLPPVALSLLRFTLLFLIVWLFLRCLCPLYRAAAQSLEKGWNSLVISTCIFLLTIIASSVFPHKIVSASDPFFPAFLLLSCAIIAVYPVIFFNLRNMAELGREKQRQLHTDLLYAQVEAQAREMALAKQSRHDMRHHNQQLLSLLDNGDLDGMKRYLLNQSELLEEGKARRFCENETVNNILRVYLQKAQAQGIPMDITALAERDLSISPPDLVSILANVVENALHGAAAADCDAPFIDVSIQRKHGRFILHCRNACHASLSFEDDVPQDLRGIGINSICSTAERYGGNCSFTARDGVFSCMVILDL